MPHRRAGSDVGKYVAESPKQGSKWFNSVAKMIHFAHLDILFIYVCMEVRIKTLLALYSKIFSIVHISISNEYIK